MNIFKINLLLLLFNFTVLAVPADVNAYFLPKDAALFNSVLDTYFDDIVQREVYIASYWITDQKIINKLIELKKKGINVNVIFDITTANFCQLFESLLSNDILPIVSPFDQLMHHKFIIIDDEDILTGSANLTGKALGLGYYANDENMLRIKSKEIVSKYKKAFNQCKDTIFEYYLVACASQEEQDWPDFYKVLLPELFKKEPKFRDKVINYLRTKDSFQINQLFKLIPEARILSAGSLAGSSACSSVGSLAGASLSKTLPSSHLVISMSPKQRSILLDAGHDPDKISSRAELSRIITDFLQARSLRKRDISEAESSASSSEESEESEDESSGSSSAESFNPVSQAQRSILLREGYDPDEFSNYDEAYEFIGKLPKFSKKRDR